MYKYKPIDWPGENNLQNSEVYKRNTGKGQKQNASYRDQCMHKKSNYTQKEQKSFERMKHINRAKRNAIKLQGFQSAIT